MGPASTFKTLRWVSLSPLPHWALLLLCAGVLLAALLACWGVRREPDVRKRALLWTFRGLAALALLFFLLEPGVRQVELARVKNRLAILVDRSASMGFPVSPQGSTRAQEAADLLAANQATLDRWRELYQVELYGLTPELTPLTQEVLQVPPRGERTDLLGALRTLAQDSGGGGARGLAGVVLLSDGADNTEAAQGLTPAARESLRKLGAPVSTIAVGQDAARDLAIESVKVDDFAFVRNALTVEVTARGRGFAGEQVPLTLKREGRVLGTQTVTFNGQDAVARVSFTFTPDQTGRFVLTVAAPVYPDEAVAENNSKSFLLKVIRDRVRVLLVVGKPSWDERFLRGLLKSDPNVDLISFYILRTQNDEVGVRDQNRELSLIPFPMEEIFSTKLHTFDVVVFQNFGYDDTGLRIDEYQDDLQRYVQGGGAVVMLGGDLSFGEAQQSLTALAETLPVETSGQPISVEPFQPRLTAEGLHHPVTALAREGRSSEQIFAALPPLQGMNLTQVRPGATVLLEHPSMKVNGRPAPLLALWEYGRGRALTLTTDSSWLWAFAAHQKGAPARDYDRLWNQALRWLVRDPELTNVQLSAEPASVEPGHPLGAVVTARSVSYQAAVGAQVQLELWSADLQTRLGHQSGVTGSDGSLRLEFPPAPPGAYKLRASVTQAGQSLGQVEEAVAVHGVGPERADASVRPELLRQIAQLTQGRPFTLSGAPSGTLLADVPLQEPPVMEVGRSEDQPLWDRWYFLALLAALLGAEWFLRRRFGYV